MQTSTSPPIILISEQMQALSPASAASLRLFSSSSPAFDTKGETAETRSIRCIAFFLSGPSWGEWRHIFLTISSPFLSLLSALPFILIKIYSHNLLLLSARSKSLIGNFSSRNHSSGGEETDAANLSAPCRCHGNPLNKRGVMGEKEHYSNMIADVQLRFIT